ncbi:MAG: EscU/YscU/HrcU family type III secretion system export apparatus switch protein [Clostridiaceae bacterium]|nr:EscU/YscU/HrcU family type III secretion system export apparatus switch protein [Clostridiaceae bacterium]
MSKTKSKILLSLFLITILVSSCCFATDVAPVTENAITNTVTTDDQSNVAATDEQDLVNTDFYAAEDSVTISNVVDGNAFVVAKEVTVTGEIGGDLFVVAEKLNIDGGYVYSSIFACAEEITINGVIYDLYAVCNTLNLGTNGFIYRDMRVAGSSVNMNGKVRRDAYISSENISFATDAGTIVYGNLEYSSDEAEFNAPEGVIAGTTTYTAENASAKEPASIGNTIISYVLDLLRTLILTFVIVVVLLWLTPNFVEKVGKMGVAKSFVSLGIGFATPIAFIFAGIILILSKIGISIFIPSIFLFALLGFIGTSIASIFFGKLFTKLFKMEGKVKFVLFTLASALIIWAITIIPFIGGFLGFLVWLFGIGTIIVNIFCKEKIKEDKKEIKE